MAQTRLDWSRKRVITLAFAMFGTALILGLSGPRLLTPGSLAPALWLAAFGNMVQWCAYLATTLRDEMRQDTARIVAETTRAEVAELLQPIDSKIEEIDADVHEYGDRREAKGVQLGVKIVGQRGQTNGRHLTTVPTVE